MDGFWHGWNRDFFLAAIFVYNIEKKRGMNKGWPGVVGIFFHN